MPSLSADWLLCLQATDSSNSDDDISGAAVILAKYIMDTGDMDGVMEFLQTMVRAGKVSLVWF